MTTKTANPEVSVEAFTAASNKAVKDGMEKAMGAFGDINTFSRDNIEALVESMTTAGKSVEQLNTHVIAYTKEAVEESVSIAKRLAGAKSVQEVIEVQTGYAKTSMDKYMGEVNKVTDLFASSMKDTFKPLNARVTAAVEMLQAHR